MTLLEKIKGGVSRKDVSVSDSQLTHANLVTDNPGNVCQLWSVPGIGPFWLCVDEAARAQVQAEGLPCILASEFVRIASGSTKEERFKRLQLVVARGSPVIQAILLEFPGATIKSVVFDRKGGRNDNGS